MGPKASLCKDQWVQSFRPCFDGVKNDLKVVTHGPETKDATFYMTDYQTKSQQAASYNVSALLGERFRYHMIEEERSVDIAASKKKLLTRCLNTLNRMQEFGGPQIASALLELPDRYVSHQHIPIYLDAMRTALRQFDPLLKFGLELFFSILVNELI